MTSSGEDVLFCDDDEPLFADDDTSAQAQEPWKVMVVDDEEEIHNVTQLALRDFDFEHKRLAIINAYSGQEAKQLVESNPDIALILLDVVMETDDSGLEVVKHIREVLSNQAVRIVLRTGQPGHAPEESVIVDYDINDYKAKTELTVGKLFTTVVTALRAFRHVTAIESQRRELEAIVNASARFVPREFLHVLQKHSITDIELGDQVQDEMTLLVADIRSFTTLSETMSPQENIDFINAFLGRAGPIIREHRGFIVKYMGDGLMAVFTERADDALTAAIAELQQVARRNAEQQPSIHIGIGIHTGNTVLGTVGDPERIQADLLSDTANLTCRLEGLTTIYGASIVISERTFQRLEQPERHKIRFLGQVKVKGRQAVVPVYEVLDGEPAGVIAAKLKTKPDFEQGLTLYYDKNFAEASVRFNTVLKSDPDDRAARIYLERSARYMLQGETPDWIDTR